VKRTERSKDHGDRSDPNVTKRKRRECDTFEPSEFIAGTSCRRGIKGVRRAGLEKKNKNRISANRSRPNASTKKRGVKEERSGETSNNRKAKGAIFLCPLNYVGQVHRKQKKPKREDSSPDPRGTRRRKDRESDASWRS